MTTIARALQSSDLAHHERPCDVDTVRALGLTAIRRPLGVLILEAKEACAGDSHDAVTRMRALIEAVHKLVHKEADRAGIKVHYMPVAVHMVREIMFPCGRCGGRGFIPLVYGPEASDNLADTPGVTCPSCEGSGRPPRDFKARVRVAGHPTYKDALRRFYEAVELRVSAAEWAAWDRYQFQKRGYWGGRGRDDLDWR